eukprot:7927996-Ditylum_brightwellii.AAC.1
MESKFSWNQMSQNDHDAGLGKMVVNDPAERSFSGLTRQIQCFGWISLAKAGGVSQVRKNGDMSRGFDTRKQNKKIGEKQKSGFSIY